MSRIRDNLFLKLVSVLASVLLYFFVREERDPPVSRQMIVPIRRLNAPADGYVESDVQQVEVNVSGPRSEVDRLKDGDVTATADIAVKKASARMTKSVLLVFRAPSWAPDVAVDSATRLVKFAIYPPDRVPMLVHVHYPEDPPAGFHYGAATVRPARVVVTGREDHVEKVARVVANAQPLEQGASIDDDFRVSARDGDDVPIEGVQIEPAQVHVTVPLVSEPSAKIVLVSPSLTDAPLPPFVITGVDASPSQVKIAGPTERIGQIFTIRTEDIPVRDLGANRTLQAALVIPPDISVRDLSGRSVTHVTVHILVRMQTPIPPFQSPASPAESHR